MSLGLVVVAVRLLAGLRWSDLVLLSLSSLLLATCALPISPSDHAPSPGHAPAPHSAGVFLEDHLTPYSEHRRRLRRTVHDVRECQHVSWENRTYEVFNLSAELHPSSQAGYNVHKFADSTDRRKYLVGTIAYIKNPYYTFSVLEPQQPGSCNSDFYFNTRSPVQTTIANRQFGCKLASNGGYFAMTTGHCLGNIVSDGKVVQSTSDLNANFGIRRDGSVVVGYISEEELSDEKNPFRQLIAGVVWLVRNGTNYVNESMRLECSSHEDTGKMETFVNVISARSAIGHDSEGRLVMAQIEGQTHKRGANLHEFADLLIRHGVVNAVNLDGGGSNTFVEQGLLLNYPSDHCPGDSQYRCARAVSTALCIHDVQCLVPDCSQHGSCDQGSCSCDPPWTGETCAVLNCSQTNCSGVGNCSQGRCECESGWTGDECSKSCPHGRYGRGCQKYCFCYGYSSCDRHTGDCVCDPGYQTRTTTSYGCYEECSAGFFGSGCTQKCLYPNCSGHGRCSPLNGSCLCEEGWTGSGCNASLAVSANSTLNTTDAPSPPPVTTTDNHTDHVDTPVDAAGSDLSNTTDTFNSDSSNTTDTIDTDSSSTTDAIDTDSSYTTDTDTSNTTNEVDVAGDGCSKNATTSTAGETLVHDLDMLAEETHVVTTPDPNTATGPQTDGVGSGATPPCLPEAADQKTLSSHAIAAVLLVSLATLAVHAVFCFVTRRWAYMALHRRYYGNDHEPSKARRRTPLQRRRKLRRRRAKLLRFTVESSGDCSL